MTLPTVRAAGCVAAIWLASTCVAAPSGKGGRPPSGDGGPMAAEVILVKGGELTAGSKVLRPGDEIAPGTKLHLSAGTATLAINGGRLLLKGPASFVPHAKSGSLLLGGLLASLSGVRWALTTPTVTAAAPGTEFYAEARGLDVTYLCLCSGRLRVSAPARRRRAFKVELKTQHHEAHLFTATPSGVLQTDAPVEGH